MRRKQLLGVILRPTNKLGDGFIYCDVLFYRRVTISRFGDTVESGYSVVFNEYRLYFIDRMFDIFRVYETLAKDIGTFTRVRYK